LAVLPGKHDLPEIVIRLRILDYVGVVAHRFRCLSKGSRRKR
jgi:hypothetical protein